MEIRVAGRHATVSDKTRNVADKGLARIAKRLGKVAGANIIITAENTRQLAEVTIAAKRHKVVAKADGFDQKSALKAAMLKAETQAQRHVTRKRTRKRKPLPV